MDEQTEVENTEINDDQVNSDDSKQTHVPAGFKSYDQYVADGGDPRRWKGELAFEDEGNRIAENKRLNKELKDLGRNVNAVLQQQKQALTASIEKSNADKDLQIEQLREELQAAHDDVDTRKTERLTKKISKIESSKEQPPTNQQVNQQQPTAAELTFSEFCADIPELQQNSGQFDNELAQKLIDHAGQSFDRNMTPYAASKLFSNSLKEVKSQMTKYNQKQPKTPTNTRQPGGKSVKGGKVSVNSLDAESQQMHDYLLENVGKDAASDYLKNWSM